MFFSFTFASMNADFHFKQFKIKQDKAAMKVGTDGVLLGAWVSIGPQTENVLDIGTGTGLIGLMLAQRSNASCIDAIELDTEAYVQAVENFEKSDWGDRLFCYHGSVQELAETPEYLYDLIISNPPYFKTDTLRNNSAREMARQAKTLSYDSLLDSTRSMLAKTGSCAFIIPFHEEEGFVKKASDRGLFLNRLTRVRGNSSSNIKRSLMQLSFQETTFKPEELTIEKSRHVYTAAYNALVKDFYLKL